MQDDAKFEDVENPLRLKAMSREDLAVISALLQDAAGTAKETAWLPNARRFAAVVNRFRWEDRESAETAGRPFERVRCGIAVENVLKVRAKGVAPGDETAVLSLLRVEFEGAADAGAGSGDADIEGTAGIVRLILSGGGEIALEVEALEVAITDMTRPWEARGAPRHPED